MTSIQNLHFPLSTGLTQAMYTPSEKKVTFSSWSSELQWDIKLENSPMLRE